MVEGGDPTWQKTMVIDQRGRLQSASFKTEKFGAHLLCIRPCLQKIRTN